MPLLALLIPGVGMGGGVTIVVVAGPFCIVTCQAYVAGVVAVDSFVAGAVAGQGVCQ